MFQAPSSLPPSHSTAAQAVTVFALSYVHKVFVEKRLGMLEAGCACGVMLLCTRVKTLSSGQTPGNFSAGFANFITDHILYRPFRTGWSTSARVIELPQRPRLQMLGSWKAGFII